ncbi:hypothetical protein BDQ17DRAFT_1541350 [Cyathus striatus]|nr:hypothetical protein BDQ17DRAFT_1541350 [Cyathus striatus]
MSCKDTNTHDANLGAAVERLEIEDEEERMKRIHDTLQKMASSTSPSTASNPSGMPNFDFGDSQHMKFLLILSLEASNALLASQDPATFNIELPLPPAESAPYIEMNLGLGVFEDKSRSGEDAEMEDSTDCSSSSGDSSEEDERDGRGIVVIGEEGA